MTDFLERTELLIGRQAVENLQSRHVYIAGIGGVGSYAAEALARAGIGQLTLHDADTVSTSNINRQLIALHSTIGRKKTDVMAERILDINPRCRVTTREYFMRVEEMGSVLEGHYDAIVDAIDVLNCKLAFLTHATKKGYRVYSSMGAGNRLDPAKVASGDLFDSRHCRLAKVLRKKLRQEGIRQGIQAVWSHEIGRTPDLLPEETEYGRPPQGTISTIPALFGLTLAGLVIRDFVEETKTSPAHGI
ncbi:tRNA threonylcarbamoyladenosine dehydratase [bacterium]|nr:tRNA threonylcarbamoyladenosine dehydratase [bacterium]